MARMITKLISNGSSPSAGQLQRDRRSLRRLETLVDCVFALVIVLVTLDLPEPPDSETFVFADYVVNRIEALVIAALGIVVVLVYWFQNNLLLGNLEHTDSKHAFLSIFQVFLLLLSA